MTKREHYAKMIKRRNTHMMRMQPRNWHLKDTIRLSREAKGWDEHQLAAMAGISEEELRRIEGGEGHSPNPADLGRLADALGTPVSTLHEQAGYDATRPYPDPITYLRAKGTLSAQDLQQLEEYMSFLRAFYSIPEDQPVFPPLRKIKKAKAGPTPRKPAVATGRNRVDHPWRSS